MDLLSLSIVAFVVAVIAGGIGFSGLAGQASGFAKYIGGIFLVGAVAVIIMVVAGVRISL